MTIARSFSSCAAALAALLFIAPSARADDVSVTPPDQRADPYTQFMLDVSFAASGVNETGNGGGGALRVGRAYPLKFVTFVPEGGAEFFAFSGNRDARVYGGFGGARMRLGRLLEPGVFAHVGVVGVDRQDNYALPTLDLGITLDLTRFEHFMLGAQGMYKGGFSVGGNPSFSWYTAGLSVGYRT